MNVIRGISITLTAGIVALGLAAQAGAYSAPERARSFYGGIAQTTESFNLELVIEDSRLQLLVRDRHNWPLDIRGFGATALIWRNDGSIEIELMPGARSALSAEGEFLKEGIQRVIVTLHSPGREPVKAWFSAQPKANAT